MKLENFLFLKCLKKGWGELGKRLIKSYPLIVLISDYMGIGTNLQTI